MGRTRLVSQPTNWSGGPRPDGSRAHSCLPARNRQPTPVCAHLAIAPSRLRGMVWKSGNTSGAGAGCLPATTPPRQPPLTERRQQPQPTYVMPSPASRRNTPRLSCLRASLCDPLELKFHVVRSLDSLFGVLRQASANQPIERRRNHGLKCRERFRLVFQNGGNHAGLALAIKRVVAGQHLVQHGAKGEQIASRVRFFPLQLLRGHVLHSPDDGAFGRERTASRRGNRERLTARECF